VVLIQKALGLALALQQIEALPYPAATGDRVVVKAKAPARAGLAIEVEQPDGTVLSLAVTDESGATSWQPAQVGIHYYRAVVDGVRVVAPHVVVEPTSRWLGAAVMIPLGIGLLFVCWRDARRREQDG
jgi:hypothetical protein